MGHSEKAFGHIPNKFAGEDFAAKVLFYRRQIERTTGAHWGIASVDWYFLWVSTVGQIQPDPFDSLVVFLLLLPY